MKKNSALLLIDIQNDYFPDGAMPLIGAEKAATKASALLRYFRSEELPVVHIAHESIRPGATFFLPGTSGRNIHETVAPAAGETVIVKHAPNSFLQTDLLGLLQKAGIKHLIITGMMTHMCVDATTRAALDYGFSCTLVHDATATRDLAFDGITVTAEQVQTAFIAALGSLCNRVITAHSLLMGA